MRFLAILLSIALCVIVAHASAGECSGDKHQDGDVFCGNNKISFQCSAGKLSVKETCTGTKATSHVPTPEILSPLPSECAGCHRRVPGTHRSRCFCIFPMLVYQDAASELRRCVTAHGFLGALVDTHLANDSYYDSPSYDPLWAAAVALGVPIYLDPACPSLDNASNAGTALQAPAPGSRPGHTGLGMHGRTGFGFLRQCVGGGSGRYPNLQIVLVHMGELGLYCLWRSDRYLNRGRNRPLSEVYADNLYVATSGIFTLGPIASLAHNTL
ncbi:hypothetical protein PG993_013550 [Apiospora rasikravindrae]|uniref:Amidohydrolase-related domain-containing protein n=1 Tax=Apiospora rasikravindrae TaxID=990691 RepID=A0ABR1RY45_9PEZI